MDATSHSSYFDPRSEMLDPDALGRAQLELLRRVVRLAHDRLPIYRRLCEAAGVQPSDIRSLDDVTRLPLLDKSTLRSAKSHGLRMADPTSILEVHSTSGRTGAPTVVFATADDKDAWARRNARSLWMVGLRPGDLLLNCCCNELESSIGHQYGAHLAGIATMSARLDNLELIMEVIIEYGVTAICITPSQGLLLGAHALENGVSFQHDSKLRVCIASHEACSDAVRQGLQGLLGVTTFAEYGMGEFLGSGMACECSKRSGMHVWADHFLVECIDPETCRPVADGRQGELVWTSLIPGAMGLIRYRSGDVSSLTWSPCSCGRTHPRIGQVLGGGAESVSATCLTHPLFKNILAEPYS